MTLHEAAGFFNICLLGGEDRSEGKSADLRPASSFANKDKEYTGTRNVNDYATGLKAFDSVLRTLLLTPMTTLYRRLWPMMVPPEGDGRVEHLFRNASVESVDPSMMAKPEFETAIKSLLNPGLRSNIEEQHLLRYFREYAIQAIGLLDEYTTLIKGTEYLLEQKYNDRVSATRSAEGTQKLVIGLLETTRYPIADMQIWWKRTNTHLGAQTWEVFTGALWNLYLVRFKPFKIEMHFSTNLLAAHEIIGILLLKFHLGLGETLGLSEVMHQFTTLRETHAGFEYVQLAQAFAVARASVK
jgi:hypothetical protein